MTTVQKSSARAYLDTVPSTSAASAITNTPVTTVREALDVVSAITADGYVDVKEAAALGELSASRGLPSNIIYSASRRLDRALDAGRTAARAEHPINKLISDITFGIFDGPVDTETAAVSVSADELKKAILSSTLFDSSHVARVLAELGGGRINVGGEATDAYVNLNASTAYLANRSAMIDDAVSGRTVDPDATLREFLKNNISGTATTTYFNV